MSDSRDQFWKSMESRLEPGGPKAEELVPSERPTTDRIKTHRGERRAHLMLDFQFKNGDSFGLSYSDLVAMNFNPSKGIDMVFSGYQVHLRGRGLASLYRGLLEHVVGQIQEVDEMADAAAKDRKPTAVYAIKVDTL